MIPTPMPTEEMKIDAPPTVPKLPDAKTLGVLKAYSEHPVIETDISHPEARPDEAFLYQLRAWLSWVVFLILLGWFALPLALRVFAPFPSGAYSLSKTLGFFIFAWIVWIWGNLPFGRFTLGSCWFWFLLFAALSGWWAWRDQKNLKALWLKWGRVWMVQEGAFLAAFTAFTLVKIFMSHIHDPVGEGYNGGGEAGMDYGFLASVVRGEKFPPQNMWMAGLPIGYSFYYGHLMMGILTKTLGLGPRGDLQPGTRHPVRHHFFRGFWVGFRPLRPTFKRLDRGRPLRLGGKPGFDQTILGCLPAMFHLTEFEPPVEPYL